MDIHHPNMTRKEPHLRQSEGEGSVGEINAWSTEMDRDALIHRLAEAIAVDRELLLDGWTHLALTSRVEDDSMLNMNGFCYTADGAAIPVAPQDFSIFDVLEELRDAMAKADGKKPWIAALFRIERATGNFHAEFEYDQIERWAITPANVKARAREFAPA
jgi:hypothetical protein